MTKNFETVTVNSKPPRKYIRYFNDKGVTHRNENNGPAIIHGDDGTEEYWLHGNLHRSNDLPAIIYKYEGKITQEDWYVHGKRHRKNGPAIIDYEKNTCTWYWKGELHRENEPAIVSPTYKEWRYHGAIHRIDGPARIYKNDKRFQFWLEGICFNNVSKYLEYGLKKNLITKENAVLIKLSY